MPVTATDLLKKLFAKAGVTFDGDLAQEIPDEVATSLDNSLLTIEAALNNHPKVKKKYFAEAYNGLDAELESAANEFGLDDALRAELKAEPSSTKRAVALARKIKELESSKQGADSGKTTTLQAQINELHTKLADQVKREGELKSTYEGQIKGIHIQSKLDNLLSGYKTVYDELPSEAKQAAIKALLTKELQDSDAEFTFDERGGLSLVKKDGTKILKVSEPAASNGNIQNTPGTNNGATKTANPALSSAISEARSNYERAEKSVVG
jgi:hypothetical protein